MNAAVCCPGPSLAALAAPPQADLVIGVNRVALRWPVTVWSCLDYYCRGTSPIGGYEGWATTIPGKPMLLTCADTLKCVAKHGPKWGGDITLINDMLLWLPPVPDESWTLYSMTCGMIYAGWRGARRIDLYGADMAGQLDYDGTAAGSNRGEVRWNSERVVYATVVKQLAGKGVEVVRHT